MGNYPDGVDGSHAYFNQPDPPECMNRDCMATLEPDWEFCPFCGWHIDWDAYTQTSDYDNITQPLSSYIYKG
jgi:hypothetical protein